MHGEARESARQSTVHQAGRDSANAPCPRRVLSTHEDVVKIQVDQQREINRLLEEFEREQNRLDRLLDHNKHRTTSDTLDRFKSDLLPSLERQVCRIGTLSLGSDPSDLLQDGILERKSSLGVLAEVVQTLDQIKSLISSSPKRTRCDQLNDGELSTFRMLGFTNFIFRIFPEIVESFKLSYRLRLSIFFSVTAQTTKSDQESAAPRLAEKEEVKRAIASCRRSITEFMEWCAKPDFSIIQDQLDSTAASVDKALTKLAKLMHPTGEFYAELNPQDDEEMNPRERRRRPRPAARLSGIQLDFAHMMIPVFKLSRLFLNKLSKPTNFTPETDSESIVHLFSKLTSHQLDSIISDTGMIPDCIKSIIVDLRMITPEDAEEPDFDDQDPDEVAHYRDPTMRISDFLDSISNLAKCYSTSYELMLDACSRLDSPNRWKTWFLTWNKQYSLSISNLRIAGSRHS